MPPPSAVGPAGPNRKPSWNGFAIAGFILSFFGGCLGLVLSIVGLNQAKKRGERGAGLAVAGICLSIISTIAWLGLRTALQDTTAHRDSTGVISAPGQVASGNLKVGDCFDQPSGINSTSGVAVTQVQVIPCTSPHDAEIYGETQLTYSTYPGEYTVTRDTEHFCATKFSTFVGVDYTHSELDVSYFYPTADSWNRGNHNAQCVVGEASGKTTVTTLSGAAR